MLHHSIKADSVVRICLGATAPTGDSDATLTVNAFDDRSCSSRIVLCLTITRYL